MRHALAHLALSAAVGCAACTAAAYAGDDPFADEVVDYKPGANPVPGFVDPDTALGQPERFTGKGFDPMIVSPFNPPWRPDEIVSIGAGGSLTLRFDTPVTDDPDNPYGIDLIVFGNALLVDGAAHDGTCTSPAQLLGEGGMIEVSADGINWTVVPNLAADGLFPTVGWMDGTDPYAPTSGVVPTDFTRPVDPTLQLADFAGIEYDDIRALYRGSGGGAGIDLQPLCLTQITHVRLTNPPGATDTPEIDAVADVAPRRPGDVDGDGDVDIFDLFELLGAWGPAHPTGWPAEFTGDDVIDVFDLFVLLGNWGSA